MRTWLTMTIIFGCALLLGPRALATPRRAETCGTVQIEVFEKGGGSKSTTRFAMPLLRNRPGKIETRKEAVYHAIGVHCTAINSKSATLQIDFLRATHRPGKKDETLAFKMTSRIKIGQRVVIGKLHRHAQQVTLAATLDSDSR